MMKKYVLLCLLALLLPSSALAAYSVTPTPMANMATKKDANGCYQISSAEDLYGFAAIVNGNDGYTKNTSACGKLMDNIVVNEHVLDYTDNLGVVISGCASSSNCASSWTPIGNYGDGKLPYSGTFDGDGHTISGLFIKSDKNYVGLFSALNGAKISNLGVIDSYFYGTRNSGSLVGVSIGKDTVEACFGKNSVNVDTYIVGGLVGRSSGDLIIVNSHNEGNAKAGKNTVGGLVGYQDKGSLYISESYNVGSVEGKVADGGLVGRADAELSIVNAWNAGNVAGSDSVGGLVGVVRFGKDSIMNSYNIGELNSTGNILGGITSYVSDGGALSVTNSYSLTAPVNRDAYDGATVVTENAFKDGTVATSLHDWCEKADGSTTCKANGKNGDLWGQIVGHDAYPVLSSTYDDAGNLLDGAVEFGIHFVNKCYEIYTADGLYKFADIVNGGESGACGKLMKDIYINGSAERSLLGQLEYDGNGNVTNDDKFKSWTPIGTFKKHFSGTFDGNGKKISGLYFNSTNTDYVGLFGYVSGGTAKDPVTITNVGVVDSYIKGSWYVGGLLGYASSSAIVSITNSYNGGSVDGGWSVGGLLGFVYEGSTVSITNSYNGGSVSGNDHVGVGGLLGVANGTVSITNSFALVGSADKLVGYGTVTMTSSGFASEDDFENGIVAYALHNGADGSTWGQRVGTDKFPLLGKSLTDKAGNAFVAYSIAYNLNGGSFSKYEPDFYFDGVGKDPLPKPVQPGAEFLGWYTDENDENSRVTSIGSSERVDKTFYAKWGWDGSIKLVDDCYEIYNAYGLYLFAKIVNGEHTTIAQNTAACGKLKNNIVVNGSAENPLLDQLAFDFDGNVENDDEFKAWTPIGNIDNGYSGKFDGNNHTISGLYFNGEYADYVGLFGSTGDGAEISNVGVVDSYFRGHYYVGGLVGSGDATITNSYSAGNVNGDEYVGGLVGGEFPTITNSFAMSGSAQHIVGNNESYDVDDVGENRLRDADAFHDGTIADFLHEYEWTDEDGKNWNGHIWGQDLSDGGSFPDFSGAVGIHYGSIVVNGNKATLLGNSQLTANVPSPVNVSSVVLDRTFVASTAEKAQLNTIVLPFSTTAGTTANAKFYAFKGLAKINDVYSAQFQKVGEESLVANTPYVVVLDAGKTSLEMDLGSSVT